MNLYRSWIFPVSALIKANLLFFLPSDFIRPMGEAWYRAVFTYAGWDARPFHAANLAILTANIFLVYAVARRLTASRLAALVTALLCAYERYWGLLYFDTGYVFDTLVFFFGILTLLGYVAIRQQGRDARAWELAGLAVLYICALNAKELAVALPAILLIYELLWHGLPGRPAGWKWAGWRRFAAIGVFGAMTVAFIAGRTSALTANPAYAPEFTWARFAASNGEFLNSLLVAPAWSNGTKLLAVGAATLGVALLFRSRVLVFGWCFAVVGMLPLAFVPPRWGPQFYWPLFGCALYAGFAASGAAGWVFRWVTRGMAEGRPRFWVTRGAAVALFLTLLIPLYRHYKPIGMSEASTVTDEAPVTTSTAAQMHALFPVLRHGERILFLDDPIRADWENMIFIVQLSYGDRTLVIKRVKQMKERPSAEEISKYDLVVGYRDGRLYDARAAGEAPGG
jgi:hypothetical protein